LAWASLQVVKGWRPRELCRQMGETPQLFTVLVGLYAFYVVRAELVHGRELAQQLLSIAQGRQDATLLVTGSGRVRPGANAFRTRQFALRPCPASVARRRFMELISLRDRGPHFVHPPRLWDTPAEGTGGTRFEVTETRTVTPFLRDLTTIETGRNDPPGMRSFGT
jgi:hypothetical protein